MDKEMVHDALVFIHVLSVVFMSAPLYNLIVVNERAAFGKAPFAVDRYFENIIKGASIRCYIYQLTALVTGVLILPTRGLSFTLLYENPVLLTKFILLLAVTALLSVVHFRIQPSIESLLGRVTGDAIPDDIARELKTWRLLRKRLAAVCLFIVITIVLLGMQVFDRFNPIVSVGILVLAALFSWRVFRSPVRFGWI